MANWSDAVENAILNCYLNQTNITAPTAIYLGLYSASPTDAGGGTELTGNGYARVNVTASFPAAASGACSNDVAIDFPVATGAWSAVTAVGLFDASSGGNLLAWVSKSLSALATDQFYRIPANDLDFAED